MPQKPPRIPRPSLRPLGPGWRAGTLEMREPVSPHPNEFSKDAHTAVFILFSHRLKGWLPLCFSFHFSFTKGAPHDLAPWRPSPGQQWMCRAITCTPLVRWERDSGVDSRHKQPSATEAPCLLCHYRYRCRLPPVAVTRPPLPAATPTS